MDALYALYRLLKATPVLLLNVCEVSLSLQVINLHLFNFNV